jgi:hypothetical protein
MNRQTIGLDDWESAVRRVGPTSPRAEARSFLLRSIQEVRTGTGVCDLQEWGAHSNDTPNAACTVKSEAYCDQWPIRVGARLSSP